MKRSSCQLLLLICAILLAHTALCQGERPGQLVRCGTAAYYKSLFRDRPDLEKKFAENQQKIKTASFLRAARPGALADTLPVVVHVVAPNSIQQQVTDAIIQSQIDVLNEDYAGLNADTVRIPAAFKPLLGKSRIVFRLAGTNPLNEPTNGIVRVVTGQTYNSNNFDNVKLTSLGGSDAWNPGRYINIWVVSFGTTGVLGQSVFPGDPRPLHLHGFVCDYRAFGRGASYLHADFNKGRTTTHELAHFFNLQHTWGDDEGGCGGTDFPDNPTLDDTPNQANATFGNPDPLGIGLVKTDPCSPVAPGIMYQNFLDYTNDPGMVMFTKGQQQKLEATMNTAPDRAALLASTAYKTAPAFLNDARIRRVLAPVSPLCQPSFTPEVVLRNSGTTTLTSVKITSELNNGTPVVYTWTGSLAAYTETTVELLPLTGVQGANTLVIYTSQPNGVADANRGNDTVTVAFEVVGTTPLGGLFEQDFNTPPFPPARWKVLNPDGDLTWQHTPLVGKNEAGCAWFNDWNNLSLRRHDDLVTPPLSYTYVDSVFLYFNVAAATGFSPTHTDTLTVMVTRDCGHTFTTVYKKWGKELLTLRDTAAASGSEFFPRFDEWRRDSVELEKVLLPSETFFQVYFRVSGNRENNIFLDDVRIVTQTVPKKLKEQGLLVLPTVFSSSFGIWHYQPPTGLKYADVYNAAGQLVWKARYNGNAQTFITVNLPHQPAGLYFVKLGYTDPRLNVTQKIIKGH